MNIHLGNYFISNEYIDLYLTINFDVISEHYHDNQVYMTIDVPHNYPNNTKLGKHFSDLPKNEEDEDNPSFIYALFSIKNKNSSGWNVWLSDMHPFMSNAKHQIILREFFGVREMEIQLNHEEQLIFKGLGKKMLCIGLPYIIKYYNIDPLTTPINLTSRPPLKLREYYTEQYGFIEQFPSINRGEIQGYVMSNMLYDFMNHC